MNEKLKSLHEKLEFMRYYEHVLGIMSFDFDTEGNIILKFDSRFSSLKKLTEPKPNPYHIHFLKAINTYKILENAIWWEFDIKNRDLKWN